MLAINNTRSIDVPIYMIQIHEYMDYGAPAWVKMAYFHKDYAKKGDCKYGGVSDTGKPCSNTKKWVQLHTRGAEIKKVYTLGGGPIAMQEIELAKSMQIPVKAFKVKPRF